MSFDWKGYLTVAQTLFDAAEQIKADPAKSPLCEAQFRSCISRAYYSAFCLARNYLRDVEKRYELDQCKGSSVHKTVSDVFREENDGKFQQISRILERLRVDRNCADYNDRWKNISALSAMAKLALKDASCILGLLQELSNQRST